MYRAVWFKHKARRVALATDWPRQGPRTVQSAYGLWCVVQKEGVAAFLEKRDPKFTGKASDLPDVFPS